MSVPAVHHLDCAPMSPLVGAERMVGHCLLVATGSGLVLIDTGLGAADVMEPHRLGTLFRRLARPTLDLSRTAAHQIRALGYDPHDVRDIVLTHLDLDHTGGLADFPHARVHVTADEYRAAMRRESRLDAGRYMPAHWAHSPHWVIHDTADSTWHGFAASPVQRSPDILMIPLPGHTRGHCAVAVQRPDHWLLHAGDAYFFHGEIDLRRPRCPRPLSLYQRFVADNHGQRLTGLDRLREARRDDPRLIRVFSSHDVSEFARFTAEAPGRVR
ncbi:MBL fold metallo-hydrolase [Streptomyces sp. HNM0663]|uniref:MBL fold metallo-hydrolase n=1 Tax=Streptomyces chengmaiensis TaxID=3040919 RepID=A0ABT6HRS2_9ACTN|nr:MBL fold metallo-hydrolase [Streptomyces chengmaiensis]MDH2390948.1 MBL fold metallo-hydrolase [Streptomyces chengmaiensis]